MYAGGAKIGQKYNIDYFGLQLGALQHHIFNKVSEKKFKIDFWGGGV